MIGRTVLHYKILSPLGSGGMGVVYLAEDERLGRQVALKFLPATWSQERVALERFRIEARAASALSHPGICTIYDIGNDGDTPFIVMEALKGETLRERISRGPLSVTDILEIGVQLTDALDAAHSRGIVHRDIKPANIFLSEKDRVKVLDFGLAKLGAGPSTLSDTTTVSMLRAHELQMTTPGTAIGTVSYMSPEQARGEEVDTRTDIFSLGAVIYEMATGLRAFDGSSAAVTFEAILNRTPQPISRVNPLVPSELETVVAKALEKERDRRYQHASDLLAELKQIRRRLDTASLLSGHPELHQGHDSAPTTRTSTSSPVKMLAESSWYITGAVATITAAIAAVVWVWLGLSGDQNRAQSPPVTQGAVMSPGAPPDATGPAAVTTPQAPGTPVVQPDPRPQPPERAAPVSEQSQQRPVASPAVVNPQPTQGLSTTNVPTPDASVSPRTDPDTARPPDPAPAPNSTSAPPSDNRASAPPPLPVPVAPQPATTPPPTGDALADPTDDEAAIRRVLRLYEQAIETKDIGLYRSIRPSLRPSEEALLRNSFRQVESQEVTIRVENLNVAGRFATLRISRQDTLVTGGRRQVQNTIQTLRLEKAGAGWVITD